MTADTRSSRFERLVEELLANPPWEATGPVEVKRTHASVVFLVGDRVYKLKRPVNYGFLDFTTLERRRWYCEEEVRLNRRLAPGVYLGVRAITEGPELDGSGRVLEWAVEMRRLDDRTSLSWRLAHGGVERQELVDLARRLARFHAEARGGPEVARFGRREVVVGNALENFDQTRSHRGRTVEPSVWARLRELTEAHSARLGSVFDARAERGIVRETHGDLRVDHVYLLPDGPVAIDCIEFSERFRCADPVSDLAFLVMDTAVRGHAAEARTLAQTWFEASGDEQGRELMDFYVAYRSIVRAKVAGLALKTGGGQEAVARARRHWLFALTVLEEPERRPALLGVGGLPGTGKSTLAAGLSRSAGFEVIRTDVVRRELHPDARPAAFGAGVYSESERERVFEACLDRAEERITAGHRVLVDASFSLDRWRRALHGRAIALGVPSLLLMCEAPRDVALQRLAERRGDASDADAGVYQGAEGAWQAPGPETEPLIRRVDCGGTVEAALDAALEVLRAHVPSLLASDTGGSSWL